MYVHRETTVFWDDIQITIKKKERQPILQEALKGNNLRIGAENIAAQWRSQGEGRDLNLSH